MSATTIIVKPVQTDTRPWALLFGIAVLAGVLALPDFPGLPTAGHRMLAVFAFAVIVWITEALDYAVSAIVIAALMAFLLGTAPDIAKPTVMMGTAQGLTLAVSGFGNTALTLVAAALFLATAMTITGLDRRIALLILSLVGARVSRVVIGGIIVTIVLSFLVPSATARAAAVVPIMMGIVLAFGLERNSRFASLLLITTVQSIGVWNVGVKTAAAQNMIAIGFIQRMLGTDISWLEWLVAAAPFSIALSIILYWVMMLLLPPEDRIVAGGQAAIDRSLASLGPITGKEKRLLAVTLILLGFWSTEQILHSFDSATTTTAAVALLFMPGIGVMTWKEAQPRIPWGTVVLFGVGISLGTALLQTKAAAWLANLIVAGFALDQLGGVAILAVLAAFLIVIHLGFASATALAAAMIPIVISVLQKVQTPGVSVIGVTMLLQFVISFGFVLPVNSPQGTLAYGMGAYAARDFVRTGIVLTVAAYMLTLLFGATYWHWLGYV